VISGGFDSSKNKNEKAVDKSEKSIESPAFS